MLRSIAAHCARQMLLDAGAEAEMRALGIEQHGRRLGLPRCSISARSSAAIMAASIRFAFGRFNGSRSSRPSASNQTLSGAAVMMPPSRPRHHAFGQLVAPWRVGGERSPQRDEVDLAAGLAGAFVEGAEAGARFGHHVEREPGARVLLVAVPGIELGLAQLLDRLGGAVREGVEQLGAQRLDLLVETD